MMYMQIEERERIVRLSPGTFHNLVVMQEHGLKNKKNMGSVVETNEGHR